MIDIRFLREHPDLVRENAEKRYKDTATIDAILKKDSEWRKLKGEADSLRAERNKLSKEVADLKKAGKSADVVLKRAQEVPDQIAKKEEVMKKLEQDIDALLLTVPNMLHPSVPLGKDSDDNKELRKWGKVTKPAFELKNHAELIEKMGFADFEAGRNNAGEGFNYLLGDMALLDHALQRYGIDFILKKGFTLVVPPMMLNFETLLGALNGLKDFEEVVYKIEKEDLYMIGTAEHTLVSLYRNRTINKKDLPLKLCALTPCFRKEIGSHGVDTKGLYRMHQFNKVEQVVYSAPEESFKVLEEMQEITEEFFKSLKIPYRVIEICSGDLSPKFAKQYDIEAWFPRQNKYGEVTSAGNCTDFQSRALNIKYYDKDQKVHPHLLNNTMVATSRALVAILENYQNKDGSVKIPDALLPYMFGKKRIGVTKK